MAADARRTGASPQPTLAHVADARLNFARAMNALDEAEVRFTNGMVPMSAMNAALTNAAGVLLGTVPR